MAAAEGPRLMTPYRAPTVAERKKWLFMTQEKKRSPHQGENLASQSPSLNKLRLSTVAKVKLTPRIFRRSKKMNKKPPVPEKSPRIKSLPVVPPRKGAPPPKPLPYNVHRSEMVKKPDPAPRKVGRQGNGISAAVSSHQDTAGNPSNTGGKEPSHLPLFGGQVSKLSSPVVQSGGIGSRPRLNTPVVKPDPDAVPQNGVSTSPVPSARAGAAVPPPTKPRPPVPDNRKLNSAQNGCGRPPLPSPPKGAVGGSCEPVYSEAYGGGFEASKDPSESDLYSTVVDSPRVVRTPTSSQTPPTPLSRSLTPPVPLPRSAQAASPPTAPSPSAGEYSLTSHAAAEQKSRSSPGVPPPTPPDTYSMLARPDQPNKPLNSAPSEAVGKVYSSLKVEEIEQLKSAKHTYNMDEGYSHLQFEESSATNTRGITEHCEVNASPVGSEDLARTRHATNPENMAIYEEVCPQDAPVSKQAHQPLSITRSAPLGEEKQNASRTKPKVVPRQLSDKNLELRGQPLDTREKLTEEGGDMIVGTVKLAPAPAPRTWKTMEAIESSSRSDEDGMRTVSNERDTALEDEDLYTIPPDAEGTPEPSPSIQEMVEVAETMPLESATFAWNKSNVTGNSNGSLSLLDEVEDGRESSSSFLRDCLSEFAKKSSELHSSPTHVMVDIDQMREGQDDSSGEHIDVKAGVVVEGEKEQLEEEGILDCSEERDPDTENCEMNAVDHVYASAENGESEAADLEDPAQYCLETVKRPHVALDAQGYCKVEVSGNDGQILSLVEDVLNELGSSTFNDLPPLSQDDDITNYDMKTVEHPPVTTNAQGYSYCDIPLWSQSGKSSGGTSLTAVTQDTVVASPQPLEGDSENGASSSTTVRPLPREPEMHAGRSNRPPAKAPKPQRRRPEASEASDELRELPSQTETVGSMPQGSMEGAEERNTELSDNDSLYAKVMDVTTQKRGNVDLSLPSPKPSPKPKRKKQVPGGEGRPPRKGHGPRRRPPPPPPPASKPPTAASLPSPASDAASAQLVPVFGPIKTPAEAGVEHKYEQTLPPYSSSQAPATSGSPLHQRAHTMDDSLSSSFPSPLPLTTSPKLPGRKGPLPPSPTAVSPQDPPSPIHRRGLFNRIKSSSLKTRKPDNHSPTTVSPLLTDEVGKAGDQSPKVGWKNKFRFRRGSGNSTSAMESCASASAGYPEEYGGELENGGGTPPGEWRRRRNQEDKLPEVPHTAKSRSLPSPSRQLVSGIHVHPYDGEDEEMEDGLYSVVNKPPKKLEPPLQPPGAAINVGAAMRQGDQPNGASKAYEVIPSSMFRARTGSRGKNDTVRRSNSVEHLAEELAPDFNIAEEEEEEEERGRVVELGSHSATSSPVLPRRRPQQAAGHNGAEVDHRGFHLGTLPRKKPIVAPPPKTRHVYATVSKSEEAAASKGTPPTTLPKPKRGTAVEGETRESKLRCERQKNFDIPTLEVVEPLEAPPPLPHMTEGATTAGELAPEKDTVDKANEDDTKSLQGLPSSEIPHERAEDGQIYAVINKKSKKKKKKDVVEQGESADVGAVEAALSTLDVSEKNEACPEPPARKPPAKPRAKPPKPAPYVPRVGSPIPAILAAAANELSSSVPPLSPVNPLPPDHLPVRSVDEPHSPLPSSPLTSSPFTTTGEPVKELPQDLEKQRARLSLTGPPSFPPPPPPPDTASSSPPLDHTYEAPPRPFKSKPSEEPSSRARKPPAKPPPLSASFDADVEDEVTPGYDVVSKPKRAREKKTSSSELATNKLSPNKQKSLPDHGSLQLSPTAFGMQKDERAKSARSTYIPRSPHLYEAVPDEVLDSNRQTTESARASAIVVPRHAHIYESPEEVRKKVRRKGPTSKKRPPPPAPPATPAKPDQAVSTVTSDNGDSPNGTAQLRTAANTSASSMASPVTEIASNPMAYLSTNMAGKRLTVDIQYKEEEEERDSKEPKFLFNKGRLSHFIHVGQDRPDTVTLSPGHSSTTQSSSSVSVYEEDSDADIMYSTDWESSSGEEDEEEEEEEEEGEEGRVIEHKPARTKTFYIAQEILTTERTYVKGLKLLDQEFRSTILSANRAHDKPVISEDTLKLILGNVGSILTLNSDLLDELEERMKIWDTDPRIGDIILNRAPYLKIYSEYISRFDKALKTLEETTKRNIHFARVLREFEAQPVCAQLPLAGYMLETVQRIPRYKLLLTDYVKHLPENSPDREASEKALGIISSVATHVNETIRQMDNFKKVMEVRKKLIGDTGDTLITPYRKLIKEGMLIKFSRKEPQLRMFFLFNDILIYASSIPPTNNTYKVIKRIPLEGMRVEMVNDPDMRHGFQIISTCKSFRLEASSNEELHQWMGAFETAIKEHREKTQSRRTFRQLNYPDGGEENERIPLGHLAPPWLPDSAVSMCQLCSVQFTVTRRRHHCRACGQIFCSDCSSYLAPLRYKSDKLGRVCQSCYESISGEAGTPDDRTPKRNLGGRSIKSQKISLPSVLREVKARDQNVQISGYLLSHATRSRRWRKKWYIVYNLVLYEFEKHEDVTAKCSVALPSYQIDTTRRQDPLVFCLRHPGTGKLYFKADTEENRDRWLEVLEKAVKGEIGSPQEEQTPQTPFRVPSPHLDVDASL